MEVVIKIIRKFRRWFNRTCAVWARVNTNSIARDLYLDQRAVQDALRNEPGVSRLGIDSVLGDIADYFDKILGSAQARLDRALYKVGNAAIRVEAEDGVKELSSALEQVEQLAVGNSAILQAKLKNRLDRIVELEGEHAAFQKTHSLARGAKLPNLRPVYVLFIGLCCLVLALAIHGWREQSFAVENASSFFYLSMPLAALCCIVPALVGAYATRDVNHHSMVQGAFGALLTGLALVYLLVLGIWYDRGFDVAPDLKYAQQIVADWYFYPSQLLSMEWTIVGTVMLVGVSCLISGYAMDDPYPGYGAIRRRLDRARDRYANLLDRQRSTLNEEVERQRKSMERILRRTRDRYNRFGKLRRRYDKKRQRYNRLRSTFTNSANSLLTRYRQVHLDANPKSGMADAASFNIVYEPSAPARIEVACDAELAAWELVDAGMRQLEEVFESTRQRMLRVATGRIVDVHFTQEAFEPLPDRVRERLSRSSGRREPKFSSAGVGS